ncbi:MAG TPA: NAD(P)-dependent oxidoreductase [Terriglobia bacterium]|nr:NAD(P)-dependent oxidoreductase [Terriglobia bacterium]
MIAFCYGMAMNMFITGATGVLGRTVTRLFVESGHKVRALARNSENESRLRDSGAVPVRASLSDLPSLLSAVKDCDAILHLATRIPPSSKAGHRAAWRDNDHIRTVGTRNLVDAALEAGVPTLLYPGIVLIYPDGGDNWLDATTPPQPTSILQSSLDAEAEVQRFTKAGNRGIVLRMGSFYGPASSGTKQMLHIARYGIAMFFGQARAYQSLIWVDDAALAVVDGLAKAEAGIYDVVDDEPLQRRELAATLAQTVGRRLLLRPPVLLLRLLAGKDAMFLTRSQRVSNRKFQSATGWSPMVPSARLGFRLLSIPP